MERLIPIEEATAFNDRVIGIALLSIVAVVFVAVMVISAYKKHLKRQSHESAEIMEQEIEDRIRKEYEKKRKSTWTFRLWAEAKRKLDATEKELAETAAERDDYKKQLSDLKQTAAACPAYNTVGKRGSFEP